MPTNTYVELQTVTVTGTAVPSIEFNSIDQSYTDLVVICSARYTSTNVGQGLGIRFNGDSTTNYSSTILEGNGSSPTSYRGANLNRGLIGAIANGNQTFYSPSIIHIQNYNNATTSKTYLVRQSGPSFVQAMVGLWRKTPEAITSISIFADGTAGNIAIGSTFSLYGIKAWASETTPKATGGYVYEDSTYWYHAFPFSSTFTPNQSLTADILCVAGGGGGGYFEGGGGAGGLLAFSAQSLTATNYSITVGAGGAGDSNVSGAASNGSNSQFGALTAAVGGGGGGSFDNNGNNDGASGGSGGGGGGADDNKSVGTGGAPTSGQGFAGGNGTARSTYHAGGGGGGAGGAGQNAPDADTPGNGGIGATSSLINAIGAATKFGEFSNGNYYFAGGGGGGANNPTLEILDNGGLGGGGNGGYGPTNVSGTNGLVSTGGGGGGNANNNNLPGPYGGSGIVVVRYAK